MKNNFTVACWQDGIYAGIMKPTRDDGTKQWKTKTKCTDEAVDAVMRWFLELANKNNQTSYAIQWTNTEGKTISLRLEVD